MLKMEPSVACDMDSGSQCQESRSLENSFKTLGGNADINKLYKFT